MEEIAQIPVRMSSDLRKLIRETIKTISKAVKEYPESLQGDDYLPPFMQETKELEERGNAYDGDLWLHGRGASEMATLNAMDHLVSLSHEFSRSPVPIWSCITLARAALEGFATAIYYLDGTITLNERLLRYAALHIYSSQENRKMNALFGDFSPFKGVDFEQLEAEVIRRAQDSGIRLNEKKSKVLRDGDEALISPSMTDMVMSALPDGNSMIYKLSSGAAHSQSWMISEAWDPVTGRLVPRSAIAATALRIAIVAAISFVRNLALYYGANMEYENSLKSAQDSFKERFFLWQVSVESWTKEGSAGRFPTY
jgi:hypothetical protein